MTQRRPDAGTTSPTPCRHRADVGPVSPRRAAVFVEGASVCQRLTSINMTLLYKHTGCALDPDRGSLIPPPPPHIPGSSCWCYPRASRANMAVFDISPTIIFCADKYWNASYLYSEHSTSVRDLSNVFYSVLRAAYYNFTCSFTTFQLHE